MACQLLLHTLTAAGRETLLRIYLYLIHDNIMCLGPFPSFAATVSIFRQQRQNTYVYTSDLLPRLRGGEEGFTYASWDITHH